MSTRTIVFATLRAAGSANADPAPKVCLAVAGDADEAVRTLARAADAVLGAEAAWRVVADASTRDALRGESAVPADLADRSAARRALRSTDADGATLDAVGDALGCAWFVTLAARAQGVAARVYDVPHHRFAATPDARSFDAHAVVLLLTETVNNASRPAASPPPATPASSNPDASVPATPAVPTDASASPAHPAVPAQAAAPVRRAATFSRVWPWLVVGGVVLGIVGAVILLRDEGTPQTTLSVVHRGGQ